ncbi:NAD-dependent dehydratase, partial [Paenibacillus sp. HN-1]|nr:NAD-dependent dehydratase [Paenibacillus sinensis]
EDPSRLYPSIVEKLLNNESPKLSKPDSVRDFISIEEVVDIYLKIVNTNYPSGEIINVGTGKQRTIEQFYNDIAKHMGKEHIQPTWSAAASRMFEPIMWEADVTKLRSILSLVSH